MAQMDRNLNLEEIDSDALFGIDALKNQTFFQKIIFFGALMLGVMANVLMPMLLNTSRIVCIFIFLGLILIGVLLGCNYTQDQTYGKYLYCYFFKPVKTLRYESTEDLGRIRKEAEKLNKKEEEILKREKEKEPKEQRKLLIKLLIFLLVLVLMIAATFIYVKEGKGKSYHHEVNLEEETNGTGK